ncbi:acyltransferase family protein [Caballeronia mineralivorans]|uniref:acyltransferase family protein n=1 Tax=Caballeronia mineralivorans TaxID=2010198 RepID=UPI0009E2477E|nr:SGNH hydrolase domain-containing protein [Caballeronia mineralivorans]
MSCCATLVSLRFAAFRGGFVGVDVFFTISGFVVTNSIVDDLNRNAFSFKEFYARRGKRLIPALYAMLAATFVFSLLFCVPEDTFRLGKNILAVATMTSNIFLAKQTGYFAPEATDQPLLHTWSLSVEEQFYVVLPLLLASLYRKARKWTAPVLVALTIASFAFAVLQARRGSSGAYYFAQYRGFEFLIGALLALYEKKRAAGKAVVFDVVFATGIAIILAGILGVSVASQFPGLGAIVPCVGALIVIYSGRRAQYVHALLSNRVAVFLGRISYPIYLWHWPLFFAFRRFGAHSVVALAAAMAATLGLAAVTYWVIERRAQRVSMGADKTLLAYLAVPLLAAGIVAGVGKLTDGFLFAYPARIQADVRWSGTALFDMPRAKDCWSKVAVTAATDCMLGNPRASDKAVLWGDSHAYHLIYFFDKLGRAKHIAVHDLALTLCPPIENEPLHAGDPTYEDIHAQCVAHDREVMKYVMSNDDIKTVFMAAAWQNYQNYATGENVQPSGHGFMPRQLERELGNTIGKLVVAGKRVVLVNDVPMIPNELINCAFYNDLFFPVQKRVCQFDASIAQDQHAPIKAMLGRLKEQYPQVAVMHTFDVPCSDGVCKLDFDGLPIYRYNDYHHLSLAGSSLYFGKYVEKHPGEVKEIFGDDDGDERMQAGNGDVAVAKVGTQ